MWWHIITFFNLLHEVITKLCDYYKNYNFCDKIFKNKVYKNFNTYQSIIFVIHVGLAILTRLASVILQAEIK